LKNPEFPLIQSFQINIIRTLSISTDFSKLIIFMNKKSILLKVKATVNKPLLVRTTVIQYSCVYIRVSNAFINTIVNSLTR